MGPHADRVGLGFPGKQKQDNSTQLHSSVPGSCTGGVRGVGKIVALCPWAPGCEPQLGFLSDERSWARPWSSCMSVWGWRPPCSGQRGDHAAHPVSDTKEAWRNASLPSWHSFLASSLFACSCRASSWMSDLCVSLGCVDLPWEPPPLGWPCPLSGDLAASQPGGVGARIEGSQRGPGGQPSVRVVLWVWPILLGV